MQMMSKLKIFFTILMTVVLFGCSPTDDHGHEAVVQLRRSPHVVEYFPAGGEDLENVVAQDYLASVNQGRLKFVSTNTTALYLEGNFTSFDRSQYESVTAIEWNTVKAEDGLGDLMGDDSQSVKMDEAYVQRVLESLSHFPRLKYLTLNFSGEDENAMLTVSLARLSQLKELEYLKLEGVKELFTGFNESMGKLKLKSLVFDGYNFNWYLRDGNSLGVTTMVSTFAFFNESPVERLDMGGMLLLEQGSLRCLKNVKVLVPPVYYSLRDVPKSVEKLNLARSEVPLDGFEALSQLGHLKSVEIQDEDEEAVRRILAGRTVEIKVLPDDECRRRTRL